MHAFKSAIQAMETNDARNQFANVLARVGRKEARVLVNENGTPVAAIVSANDLHRLDQLDQERIERFKVIDEMRVAFQDVPVEEIEREGERALAEVRAEMRVERARAIVRS